MQFTWDPKKAASNLKKHRVSFEEATTVFADAHASFDRDLEHGEPRLIVIGHSNRSRLLFVVAFEASAEGAPIRIISARRANAAERAEYEEP